MAELSFQCPSCMTKLKAAESLAAKGANIRCPRCQTLVSLAGLAATAPARLVTPAAPEPEPEPEPLDEPIKRKKKKKKKPRPLRRSTGSGGLVVVLGIVLGLAVVGGLIGLVVWQWPKMGTSRLELVVKEIISSMDRASSSLERIHDRQTALAEVALLSRHLDQLATSMEAAMELERQHPEEVAELTRRYEAKFMETSQRFQAQMTRIANQTEAMLVVAPAILEFSQRLQRRGQGGSGRFGVPGLPRR